MIMHNAPMKRNLIPLILLAAVALAGCQTIKAHNPFRHKAPDYQAAQQEKPLEVPPGMDQPPTTEALTIPSAGSGAAPTSTAAPAMTAPPAATAVPSTTPPAVETAPRQAAESGGTGLQLSDTPDSAYHRVGLALARGGVGQVTAHDDASHTYQVAVNATETVKSEGGFFHRLFHHSHTETVTGTVTVSVAPQGAGSEVQATGNPAAAAKVMAVLRQRLQ